MDSVLFWGGCVVAFMIFSFSPPREVKKAMLRESEARERRNQWLLQREREERQRCVEERP